MNMKHLELQPYIQAAFDKPENRCGTMPLWASIDSEVLITAPFMFSDSDFGEACVTFLNHRSIEECNSFVS